MIVAVVNIVNQQEKLKWQAVKELADTFEEYIMRLAAIKQLQADYQKSLPPKLSTLLFK